MKVNFWLAWRELRGRKSRFILNITLVALAVGLCISMEMISRSRGQAVDTKINLVGPPLRIVPEGAGEGMVTRYNIGKSTLPANLVSDIKSRFKDSISSLEGRLLFRADIKGASVPVTGFDRNLVITPAEKIKELELDEVAVGNELGRELKIEKGNVLEIGGGKFTVKFILPTLGNNEDASLFMNLEPARKISGMESAINVISIYPGIGVPSDVLGRKITGAFKGTDALGSIRGEVADSKVETSLELYRVLLYGFAAFIVIITLMISSHINASERKIELATLFAIGTTGKTVFLTLVSRAFIVGTTGAFAGYLIGVIASLVYDFRSASGVIWSAELFLLTMGITAAVSSAATIPVSIVAGFRNHVPYLQED